MKKVKNWQKIALFIIGLIIIVGIACMRNYRAVSNPEQPLSILQPTTYPISTEQPIPLTTFKPEITKTDQQWHQILTTQQYYVLRQEGTDIPFSDPVMLNEHRKGTFVTVDCNQPVFRSEQKFDSGTGWPSFWAPIKGSVAVIEDNSLGIKRLAVVATKCGGHLGHVFNDGPAPTGLRYCIDQSALKFIPDPNQ